MKIRYVFCNEEVEIEVSEKWGAIILDMDREERNNNQTESRRHCSLDAIDQDGNNIPSAEDLEADYLEREEREELHAAIKQLSPRQQGLIRQVYFEGRKYSDIATQEGKDESSIRHATERAAKKIKNLCSRPSGFAIFVS